MKTDATSSVSVNALVRAYVVTHGRINILVINVGDSQPGCPATMDKATWDTQMNVNLRGAYLAYHHALSVMERWRPAGGAIVCVSSIAGMRYIGKPQVAYGASKAALMHFVKAAAVVYARRSVGLNTIVPDLIETPYTRHLTMRFPTNVEGTG